jgi:hypothetical protein
MGAIRPDVLHVDLMRGSPGLVVDDDRLDAETAEDPLGNVTGRATVWIDDDPRARSVREVRGRDEVELVVDGPTCRKPDGA